MGKAQPDNYNGEKAGRQHNQHHIHVDKLVLVSRLDGVKDKSGLTVEGLQEYYDEACLAVLNNRSAKCILLTPLTSMEKSIYL